MSKEKEEFEFASIADVKEVATYLDSMAKGFREGRVSLASADHEISLTPGGELDVEILAKNKEDKSKIEIQISWKKTVSSEAETLSISSGSQAGVGPAKEKVKV